MNVPSLLIFIGVAAAFFAVCALVYRRYRYFFSKSMLKKLVLNWFGLRTLARRHRERRIQHMRLEVEKCRRLMWHKDDFLTRNRANIDTVNQRLHYLKSEHGIYLLEDQLNEYVRQGMTGKEELDQAMADLEKTEKKYQRYVKHSPGEEHYEARAIGFSAFDSGHPFSFGRTGSHSARFPIQQEGSHLIIDDTYDGPPAIT